MPPRSNPSRRRADPNAGPAIVDERVPLATVPAPAQPAPTEQVRPRKFTALLDTATDARYGRLLDALRTAAGPVATRSDGNGRSRAGYDLSRADLLRALLEVAEEDPTVMTEAVAKAQRHYGTPS